MKKILSILLAVCMLLTMFTLPAFAEVTEADYEYFKFPFNGDPGYTGNKIYYGLLNDAGTGEATWMPLMCSSASTKVEVKQVDYNGTRAIRVRVAGGSAGDAITIAPRTTNADPRLQKPIKFEPGKDYNVNYKIDITRYGNGSTTARLMSEAYLRVDGSADANASLPAANTVTEDKINISPVPGADLRNSAFYFTTVGKTSYKLLQGKKGATSNIGAYAGLYCFSPTNINGYSGLSLTQVNTVNSSGAAVSSTNGVGKYTITKKEVMNALPVSGVEGAWNDLADWGITPRMTTEDEPRFTGFYSYDKNGDNNIDKYSDHFGITLPTNSTGEYIKVEGDVTPVAGTNTITVGEDTYCLAYNEYYIYDLEYFVDNVGCLSFDDGNSVQKLYGEVGTQTTMPTPAAQEGKLFLGWYKGDEKIGNAGSTITFKKGAPYELTAKWAINAVTVVDDITIMGKDIQINGTNYVNGTAVSSYTGGDYLKVTDKALVLTSPNVRTGTFTSTTKADYIMSAKRGNDRDYTIVGADGKPVVAEPNTEYIINISYKQTKPGRIGLRIGAGRSTSKATATTANTGDLGQNSAIAGSTTYINNGNRGGYYINFGATDFPATFNQGADALHLTAGTVDTTVQTYSFGIKTKSLEGMIPEFNMISVDFGTMGRYVSTDENGNHTYECVGVPEVEIYSIQILKVGSNENVVAFNGFSNNVGSSLVYKAGVAGSEVEVPDNFEDCWYKSNSATTSVFDGKVPNTKLTPLYDYGAVVKNIGYGDGGPRNYIGVRGITTVLAKDGEETIHALQYKPRTYAEAFEWTGVGLKGEAEMPDEATQLKNMKEICGRGLWNMYRIGVANAGTYKITLKYKATVSSPVTFRFAVGSQNNVVDSNTNIYLNNQGPNYTVSESTDGFVTKELFITVDNTSMVTEDEANLGRDDNFAAICNYLYLHFYHDVDNATFSDGATQPEILISDIELKEVDAVNVGGASALTDEAVERVGKQAMRVYFSYKTDDGDNIIIDGKEYAIKERGFLYNDGAIDAYTTNGCYKGLNEVNCKFISKINANFNNCWAYDEATSELTFSNYIGGFKEQLHDSKVLARAYVIFEDAEGNEFTVYSGLINRSINGILDAGDVNIEIEDVPGL